MEEQSKKQHLKWLWNSLLRTKKLARAKSGIMSTELRRCLTTFDITLIGISSTLGSGVYILTGEVSQTKTGPSIVISITLAAIASILSGLCYTEFAARVPKAGSAYVYSYVVIGEFFAFIVGWNLVLEYGIGAAAVIKGLTSYTDALLDHRIENFTISIVGQPRILGADVYLDFFSCIICILVTIAVSLSVKISSYINSVCTLTTIVVIVMIISMGSFYANTKNLADFFPYGVTGVISGASSCYYAFIGFDAVCMVAEEAKYPNKSIPISVIITIFSCYCGFIVVSLVLNMMIPYTEMHGSASLATAFEMVGLPEGKYVIGIGAIFGLLGNAISSMMMMPRFLYSMALDGLIFAFFAKVHQSTNIPFFSTIFGGFLTGGMALFFSLHALVDMVSIGTIIAYSLVTVSVLMLRYQRVSLGMVRANTKNVMEQSLKSDDNDFHRSGHHVEGNSELLEDEDPVDQKIIEQVHLLGAHRFYNCGRNIISPTVKTELTANVCTFMLLLESFGFAGLLHLLSNDFRNQIIPLIGFCTLTLVVIITTMVLSTMPQNSQKLFFKVPFLPWLPVGGLFLNVYLLLGLSKLTWIRFGVWMAVGLLVYFTYGFWNSKQRVRNDVINEEPQENSFG